MGPIYCQHVRNDEQLNLKKYCIEFKKKNLEDYKNDANRTRY